MWTWGLTWRKSLHFFASSYFCSFCYFAFWGINIHSYIKQYWWIFEFNWLRWLSEIVSNKIIIVYGFISSLILLLWDNKKLHICYDKNWKIGWDNNSKWLILDHKHKFLQVFIIITDSDIWTAAVSCCCSHCSHWFSSRNLKLPALPLFNLL